MKIETLKELLDYYQDHQLREMRFSVTTTEEGYALRTKQRAGAIWVEICDPMFEAQRIFDIARNEIDSVHFGNGKWFKEGMPSGCIDSFASVEPVFGFRVRGVLEPQEGDVGGFKMMIRARRPENATL